MSEKIWLCFSKEEFFNLLAMPDFAFKSRIYNKYHNTGIAEGSPKDQLNMPDSAGFSDAPAGEKL